MFRDLYDHMHWADATVWRAVLKHSAAAEDKRVRDLLLHLHMTQRAFLAIWHKEKPQFANPESFASADAIANYGREYHEQVTSWIDAVTDDRENEPMVMPWAKRFHPSAQPTVLRDTLLQVPMHSTYHRGQVNARLRELGGEPPLVDYIAWIWMGKPRAEWPH